MAVAELDEKMAHVFAGDHVVVVMTREKFEEQQGQLAMLGDLRRDISKLRRGGMSIEEVRRYLGRVVVGRASELFGEFREADQLEAQTSTGGGG
jgi:hypothetical protein